MPTPFAALETRLNAAVAGHLANVTAVVGSAVVEGIFDQNYQDSFGLVSGTASSLLLNMAAVEQGTAVVLPQGDFTVAECRPENGMTRLLLTRA